MPAPQQIRHVKTDGRGHQQRRAGSLLLFAQQLFHPSDIRRGCGSRDMFFRAFVFGLVHGLAHYRSGQPLTFPPCAGASGFLLFDGITVKLDRKPLLAAGLLLLCRKRHFFRRRGQDETAIQISGSVDGVAFDGFHFVRLGE
jgi:hypothetical protein